MQHSTTSTKLCLIKLLEAQYCRAGWPPVGRSQVEREKHLGSLIARQKTRPANQEKGWRCQSPVAKWEKHSCHLNFFGWRVGV